MNPLLFKMQTLVHQGKFAELNACIPQALDLLAVENPGPEMLELLTRLESMMQGQNWHALVDLLCDSLKD